MKVTIIDTDDWSAVYFDDALQFDGHTVRYDLLLSALVVVGRPVVKWVTAHLSGDWVEAHGLPAKLTDIPKEAYD